MKMENQKKKQVKQTNEQQQKGKKDRAANRWCVFSKFNLRLSLLYWN